MFHTNSNTATEENSVDYFRETLIMNIRGFLSAAGENLIWFGAEKAYFIRILNATEKTCTDFKSFKKRCHGYILENKWIF